MKIIKAKKEHLKELMQLELNLYKKWHPIDDISKIDKSFFLSKRHEKRVLDAINSKTKNIFIAVADRKIAGYLKAEIMAWEPFYQKVGYISQTYVLPKYRKKKIGRELVKYAISFFRKRKVKWTTVGTHSLDKEANSFWNKQGYKEFNKILKRKVK